MQFYTFITPQKKVTFVKISFFYIFLIFKRKIP